MEINKINKIKLDNNKKKKKMVHTNIDLSSFSRTIILDFDLAVYTHDYYIKIKN